MTTLRRIAMGLGAFAAAIVACAALLPTTSANFSARASSPSNSLVAASSFYRQHVVSDAPVSYWRLGEASGTTATDVMGVAHGTYAGGYTLGAADPLVNDTNTAVTFDGLGGRMSAPAVAANNLTSKVSIEAWVNPTSLTGTRWIVNKGTYYYLYISNGMTYFGIRSPGGFYVYASTTAVTTGSWQHLVGTFNGTSVELYRNGTRVAQVSHTGTIEASSTSPIFVGAIDATGSYYQGGVDEVAIYATALTPAQISAHYARGATTQ